MSFPQGHALLIGVGMHQYHAGLDVPITVADAQAVADVLQDARYCGYPSGQVKVIHDAGATKAGILSALDQLAAHTHADHTVFLFYCGHGALGTDGNYYLVSHDAKLQAGRVVADTGVSEGELLAKLRTIAAQRVLMVFNACHSGNISPTLSLATDALEASNPDEEATSALLGTGQGRIILVACREQQVSYIGQGAQTIFTQALIDGLQGKGVRNNNGFISAFSLYEHLYETVREVVQTQFNATQEPELTVLKGVGPFAVARYRGASTLGDFDPGEALPQGMAVREVAPSRGERAFNQRVVQSGSGGIAIGRHAQAAGERGVVADTIYGPVSTGDNTRQIQTDTYQEGGVHMGNVAGGIHGSVIAGRDARQVQPGRATSDPQDDAVAQSPALQSLRAILSGLYETEADARRIAQESGIDTQQVNFSTKPVNFWHNVLVEAHNQAKVKALVSNASFEYGAKAEALRQAYQAYTRSS